MLVDFLGDSHEENPDPYSDGFKVQLNVTEFGADDGESTIVVRFKLLLFLKRKQ
ncbi:MAG: hypothetical protein AAGA22_03475 [Pseudomonadota bacterium]